MLSNLLSGIITVTPFVLLFFNKVGFVAKVRGSSMSPTLEDRVDYVFVERDNSPCKVDDIVVYSFPTNPSQLLVKRVKEVNISPLGQIWIEGDNYRTSRLDSKDIGPVSEGLVVGKIRHRVWPLAKFGKVE
eukprot:TRINITY_DN188_c1_g1_i1.p1 TRINITY_DN188_c1_g1~~TRINITY_DN188_c1_g1_i1.p1  ORF type:complete len:131 (-),score=36.28 TRINITY_DN188_c1_g1_i1:85-477(-)